jgi:hypothetical protein
MFPTRIGSAAATPAVRKVARLLVNARAPLAVRMNCRRSRRMIRHPSRSPRGRHLGHLPALAQAEVRSPVDRSATASQDVGPVNIAGQGIEEVFQRCVTHVQLPGLIIRL